MIVINLKEAFRFQNKLQILMDQAQEILNNDQNLTKVEITYLCKKAKPGADDETFLNVAGSEYYDRIDLIAEFLLYLLSEHEKISASICSAKESVPFNAGLDGEVELNRKRQEIVVSLRRMADMKNSERVIHNGGTSYCFNLEGNQISYRCDLKQVTTINFDRKQIRKMCSDLSKKVDYVSAGLDAAIVNIKVDYNPPFSVNDLFADVFEVFVSQKIAA